jgi:hypothetical protein
MLPILDLLVILFGVFCRRHEHSHVKSNLVHKLYRVKHLGRQKLEYFKDMVTPEEYKAAEVKQGGKNWTWYSLTQDALNGILYQVASSLTVPSTFSLHFTFIIHCMFPHSNLIHFFI